MASITVKNIPDDLLVRLRQAAKQHNRSVNREIIDCLEQRLMARPIDTEEIIRRARELRRRGPRLNLGELHAARRDGRR